MAHRPQSTLRPLVGAARSAFSLLEVLLVIAVIALLMALLIPGLGAARERARRLICAGNLRQWGIAVQFYRDDNNDYLPQEGTYRSGGIFQPGRWYNELPPYLSVPAYKDVEGANEAIKEFPNMHVWICPSKNLTGAYKSDTGMNQFHYGMNQVLDGMGDDPDESETPDFLDMGAVHLPGHRFLKKPNTVFMFDIAPNSPNGSPRDVATQYQQHWGGGHLGKFHGDFANLLYLTLQRKVTTYTSPYVGQIDAAFS